MGTESKKIRAILPWFAAVVFMILWSVQDSLIVVWAAARHPRIPKIALDLADSARTDFKREEQKYFLSYGLYIPLEDMMYGDQLSQGAVRYAQALRKSCSGMRADAGFAIWLPLRTRWPLFGERVMEWCWKPSLQR
jgi:hypothetical protein